MPTTADGFLTAVADLENAGVKLRASFPSGVGSTIKIAPTRAAYVRAQLFDNTASKTSPIFNVLNGDLVVIKAVGETTSTFPTPTWTGSGTVVHRTAVASGSARAVIWTIAVTADAAGRAVSISSFPTADRWTFDVSVIRDHGGVDTFGNAVGSGAPALNLTTAANAMVLSSSIDTVPVSGVSRVWRTINSSKMTEETYWLIAGGAALYAARHPDVGASGVKTLGLTAPSGQAWGIAGISILPKTVVLTADVKQVIFYRGDGSKVRSGDPAWAIADSTGFAYDHEADLTGETYSAQPIYHDGELGPISQSLTVTLDEPTGLFDLWLKSINDPSLSMLVSAMARAPLYALDGRLSLSYPLDSALPVGSYAPATDAAREWIVRTETVARRKQLRALIASGPLFVQPKTVYGEDPFYALVERSATEVFVTMADQRRNEALSLRVIKRPPTLDAALKVPGFSIRESFAAAETITDSLAMWPTVVEAGGMIEGPPGGGGGGGGGGAAVQSFKIAEIFYGANNTAWPAPWSGPVAPTNQRRNNGKGELIPGNTVYATSGGMIATGIPDVVDLRFIFTMTFATSAAQEQYFWACWRSNLVESGGQIVNGYRLQWNPTEAGFTVTKFVASVATLLGTITFAYPAAGASFRIDHVGGVLKVKAWAANVAEPSTWNLETVELDPYLGATGEKKVGFKATNGNSTTVRMMTLDDISLIDLAAPMPTMPSSEPAGFTRIFSEDFLQAFPVGSFLGVDVGGIGTIEASSPAYPYYGSRISVYPDNNGYPGDLGNGRYYNSKVMSTRNDLAGCNGVMDFHLHTETISGTPRALSAWIRPITVNDVGQKLLYGRFQMRMRADSSAAGYGAVMLLIGDVWPDQGELDWPEGDLGGAIQGFYHFAAPSGTTPFQEFVFAPGAFWADWHIYTIEWTPGRVKFFIDDACLFDTTDRVGANRMKFVLQSGVHGSIPSALVAGHLQTDWLTVASAP